MPVAFNALADLARDLQLGAEVEYIQLGGNVDLNRDNLVVICGPRISPLIAEVLKTDPVLQFERHDSGWFLTDRRTGHAYHSPSDNPALPPGDVAYLSRQARPAGNGSFILLTGIHAVGSNGVIHYLTRELADLYEQVGTRRFSTLIASEFDPATRTITSSRRITPLYLHEDAVAVTDRVVVLLDGASVPMAWRLAAAMGPPGMSASSVQSRLAS